MHLKTDFTSTKTHSNMKVNAMQQNDQISFGKISISTLKRILFGIYLIKPGRINQKQKGVCCV